eukprot:bmy_09587T0
MKMIYSIYVEIGTKLKRSTHLGIVFMTFSHRQLSFLFVNTSKEGVRKLDPHSGVMDEPKKLQGRPVCPAAEGSTQLGNKTAFSGKVKRGTQPADSTELLQVVTSKTENNWRQEHQHRIQKGSLSGRWISEDIVQQHQKAPSSEEGLLVHPHETAGLIGLAFVLNDGEGASPLAVISLVMCYPKLTFLLKNRGSNYKLSIPFQPICAFQGKFTQAGSQIEGSVYTYSKRKMDDFLRKTTKIDSIKSSKPPKGKHYGLTSQNGAEEDRGCGGAREQFDGAVLAEALPVHLVEDRAVVRLDAQRDGEAHEARQVPHVWAREGGRGGSGGRRTALAATRRLERGGRRGSARREREVLERGCG